MLESKEDQQRLESCVQEIAAILYRNTPPSELKDLDSIEQAVRRHMLTEVSPRVGIFLSKQRRERKKEKVELSKAASES
jgi:hypothetical protein